jgi:hypothetical protein
VQVEAVARDGFVAERCGGLGGTLALAGVVFDVLERAALRGELGEPLGEGAFGRLVRRVVVLHRVPALAKPGHDPESDALGEDVELGAARRGGGHEARCGVVTFFDVDAIEGAGVQMHMEVEARAEPLHERDGARVKLAGQTALLRGALVVARELVGVDARERPKHVRLGRGQQRQLEGERQDELPNGHRGQHAVHQVRRLRRHAPTRAARAETAILARERDEQVVLAPMASEVDEAPREVTAEKIPTQLVLDVARKRPVVGLARVAKELRAVLLHETIEHRRVWLARQVATSRAW